MSYQDYVPNPAQAALHTIRGLNRVHTFVGGRGAGATTALLMDPLVNGYMGTDSMSLHVSRDIHGARSSFTTMRFACDPNPMPDARDLLIHWPLGKHTSLYRWLSPTLLRDVDSMRFRHIAVDGVDDMGEEDFVRLEILLRGDDARMVVSVRPGTLLGDTWQSRVLANRAIAI